jgi:hypothetical protein
MRQSRYKYFSNLDYARQFLDGKVFHQTLAFFRDYEDAAAQQIIGDEFESTRLYRPLDGLRVNNLTRRTTFPLQMGFESSARAAEIYVFCISFAFSEELKREFRAQACVEILRPAEFIRRWLQALPPGAAHFSRKVDYYRAEDVPGNVWPQPHLIATTKLARFAYQAEYRLGFSTAGALEFGQTTQQLVDRKTRPVPKLDQHHHWTLDLGDLRDICTLHACKMSTGLETPYRMSASKKVPQDNVFWPCG